jgi:hypothetical protein
MIQLPAIWLAPPTDAKESGAFTTPWFGRYRQGALVALSLLRALAR